MQAIDTNVLVRYLTQDDAKQSPIAQATVEQGEAKLVSTIVLAELVWVLSSVYELSRADISSVLGDLEPSGYFCFANSSLVRDAISRYRSGFDLSDALIASSNQHEGAEETLTFDKKASKMKGFRLLK